MDGMTTQERIDVLQEAQEMIDTALEMIKDALRYTNQEAGAKAYLYPTLAMAAHEEHGYLGRQFYNLDEIIEALQEEAAEEDWEAE